MDLRPDAESLLDCGWIDGSGSGEMAGGGGLVAGGSGSVLGGVTTGSVTVTVAVHVATAEPFMLLLVPVAVRV